MKWDQDPRFGESVVHFVLFCFVVSGTGAVAGSLLWEDWGLLKEWAWLAAGVAGGLMLYAAVVFTGGHLIHGTGIWVHHMRDHWHHRHHH